MKQRITAHFWAVNECLFLFREAKYEKIPRHAKRGEELHYKIHSAGQSLMELVVGVSLITVVIGAVAVITTYGLRNSQFSKNQAQATKLAQEKLELVRAIKSSNYGICLPGEQTSACSSWENVWSRSFGIGEEYRISANGCTVSGVSSPYCLQYKGPNSTWDLGGGLSGEIIIKDEVANQKRVISRIYWTDTSGVHSSDLVTVFSKL